MTDKLEDLGLVTKPGWVGFWIPGQVDGAIPNGARFVKVKTEPKDTHAIGAKGNVLSSVQHPDPKLGIAYFVEWDEHPKTAVLVLGWKIAADK